MSFLAITLNLCKFYFNGRKFYLFYAGEFFYFVLMLREISFISFYRCEFQREFVILGEIHA